MEISFKLDGPHSLYGCCREKRNILTGFEVVTAVTVKVTYFVGCDAV
jgi:hypothetical protein